MAEKCEKISKYLGFNPAPIKTDHYRQVCWKLLIAHYKYDSRLTYVIKMDSITGKREALMVRTIYVLIFIAVTVLLNGCVATSQNLGTIKESHDVTKYYRSLKTNPDYNYFYSGTKLQPDAIMGLDKIWTVQSKFWHPVDLTEEQLQYWVTWGDRQSADEGFSTRYLGKYMGAYILDIQGKTIGDWYSKKDWGIFEFPGDNVIIPHPPKNRVGSQRRGF